MLGDWHKRHMCSVRSAAERLHLVSRIRDSTLVSRIRDPAL